MPDRTPPPGARRPLGTGCPECDAPIDATYDRCPRCALPLRGPVATQLWHVDRALADLRAKEAELLERRGGLLARLLPMTSSRPWERPRPGSGPPRRC
ncbi:hypothetical protein ACWDUI_30915 [Streptosporangium sandarakinum]